MIYLRFFLTLHLLCCGLVSAAPSYENPIETAFSELSPVVGTIVSRREVPEIQATELLLGNGMRVCLRPNALDDDELLMQVFAVGGSTSLPSEQYLNSQFAPYLAWASGTGKATANDLSTFLTDYDIDFSMSIFPHYRRVKASCHANHLKFLLQLYHLRLTQQNFNKEVLPEAITLFREVTTCKQKHPEEIFEQEFYHLNTQNHPNFRVVTDQDIESVHFETARTIFQQAFFNPAEFTVVLAGNFKTETIEPLITTYLASIPPLPKNTSAWPTQIATKVSFPKKTLVTQIACGKDKENLTRITFPCSFAPSSSSFHLLDFASQILETRLRNVIREKSGVTYGADVGYEFPTFPRLNTIWLTVQYRCDQSKTQKLSRIILWEFANLCKTGPTEQEIKDVRILKQRMYDFWSKETHFWLAMLTNYYLWDWDLKGIAEEMELLNRFQHKKVRDFFRDSFTTNFYTQITMKDESSSNRDRFR